MLLYVIKSLFFQIQRLALEDYERDLPSSAVQVTETKSNVFILKSIFFFTC